MKRIVWFTLLFVALFGATPAARAQSVDAMMDRFNSCEGAEQQRIPRMMLGIMRMIIPDDTTGMAEAIRASAAEQDKMSPEEYEAFGMSMITLYMHTKALEILDLTACTVADRTRFAEEAANWSPKGFVKSDEGVLIKRNKRGEVVETIGIFYDDEECGMVHIKGDLTIEQFRAMTVCINKLINK